MTSEALRDEIANYIFNLSSRVIDPDPDVDVDPSTEADEVLALVLNKLPEKSDPLTTGLKFHNIDKDAGWNAYHDTFKQILEGK